MKLMQAEAQIQDYIKKHAMQDFLTEPLLQHLELFQFPAFSNIYIEGEDQDYLYFLVEGQVQCSHYHLNGKLAVIAISNPFTVIGDMEIFNEKRLQSNVISTRKTTMLGIEREIVHRYGENEPRFLHYLLEEVRRKLYKTNALQISQVLPLIKRLAIYLLAQSPQNEVGGIILPDKEVLSALLGTSSRHLNRVFRELIDAEMISSSYPHLVIYNRQALEELCNE